jgi:hypothetical protein
VQPPNPESSEFIAQGAYQPSHALVPSS